MKPMRKLSVVTTDIENPADNTSKIAAIMSESDRATAKLSISRKSVINNMRKLRESIESKPKHQILSAIFGALEYNASLAKKRILIADGEINPSIPTFLYKHGCTVVYVHSGKDAIKSLEEPFEVVFLDLDLPDMNGIELAKIVRTKTTSRIVLMNGHTSKEYLERISSICGAHGHIARPFNEFDFVSNIPSINTPKKSFH